MRTSIQVTQRINGHDLYAVAHWAPRLEAWTLLCKANGEIWETMQTDQPWPEIRRFIDEAILELSSQPDGEDQ